MAWFAQSSGTFLSHFDITVMLDTLSDILNIPPFLVPSQHLAQVNEDRKIELLCQVQNSKEVAWWIFPWQCKMHSWMTMWFCSPNQSHNMNPLSWVAKTILKDLLYACEKDETSIYQIEFIMSTPFITRHLRISSCGPPRWIAD